MAFKTARQRRKVMAMLNPSYGGSWHTEQEHNVLDRMGARPKPDGADGVMPDGRKVEVRSIRADNENRYRLDMDTHRELVRTNGFYYFVNKGTTKKVSASVVDRILKKNNRGWYKDRDYPHSFIYTNEVFE